MKMSPEIVKTAYCVDNRPKYPLQILATRYRMSNFGTGSGYTLILLHATGMHKETWEVFIEHLFKLSSDHANFLIEDIFSIESPNHGESAVINEETLRKDFEDQWSPGEYGRAIHTFLTCGQNTAGVDFGQRRMIVISHSVGAPAIFLMNERLLPTFKFATMIAIEPGISQLGNAETAMVTQMLTAWTWLRHDVWPSRKVAKKELQALPLYAAWDSRVLDLYINHGLRQHSAAKYNPPFQFKGVTTALTKEQEAATYRSEELVSDALEAYTAASRKMPIHLIWGKDNDVATPALQELLADTKAGRFPQSVSYVENAGHLVVQQRPDALAQLVYSILCKSMLHNKL
ncbi:alpha/beta-hydrolase [Lentinula raphanica]|uniref:Alpha/beta-hydrolase n=1 Tax=Lentinula raphanica TaxID=153919 RepID=A0AA38NZF6_9AGAR|nr:alpha/beta-hydrolase [Lentinula raphanica]